MSDEEAARVDGVSFWRVQTGDEIAEVNTRDEVLIDPNRCSWAIRPLTGDRKVEPVESNSRDVRYFIGRVVAEKRRQATRAIVRPVPKPQRQKRTLDDVVPCPLCQGEAWPDCEICGGAGWVDPEHGGFFPDTQSD